MPDLPDETVVIEPEPIAVDARPVSDLMLGFDAVRVLAFRGELTQSAVLDAAKSNATDPAFITEHGVFAWTAEISNGRLDSYYTRMMPSTLANYAADAEAGVPFMVGHNVRTLPVGRSMAGRTLQRPVRVQADFYTVRGLDFGDVPTDRLIEGIQSGLVRDVSVGFRPGQVVCNICGLDMMRDWSCPHFPGIEYDAVDDKGRPTGKRILCEGQVEDGHLLETSAVYRGATPGAGIVKALDFAASGRLTEEQANLLETQYRIAPLNVHRSYATGTSSRRPSVDPVEPPKEEPVPEPIRTEETPAAEAVSVVETPSPTSADVLAPIRAMIPAAHANAELSTSIRSMVAEMERLRPLADDGVAYRTALTDETLAEGARAMGETFTRETWNGMLGKLTIAEIRMQRDAWKAIGDRNFPGGRSTVETTRAEQKQEAGRKAVVSRSAYRVS